MSTHEPTDGGQREDSGAAAAADEILSVPPTTRDLGRTLANRPRRGMATSTGVLVAVVLLGVGFFGGLLVGRHTASGQTTTATGGFPGGFPTPSGGGFAANGFTVGTVTRVEGDTLYVKTADGSTVKVLTGSATQIRVSQEGTLQDLPPGSTVAVQGSSSGQGAIKATSISEGNFGTGAPSGGTSSSASSGSASTG